MGLQGLELHYIFYFILLLCHVLYNTTPLPLQSPASFKSLWGTKGLSWNKNYSTITCSDIFSVM